MDNPVALVGCALPQDSVNAYGNLPVGVVVTNKQGVVIFANARADAIFGALQPVGFGFRTLLSLSGITGGGDLALATETCTPSVSVRIGLPDGGIFDGRSQPASDGGALITLFEITDYVKNAEIAAHDALTGLATRSGFHQKLADALTESERGGSPVAVLYMDLDRFKMVNDTLGHPVGDALLVKVAERLRTAVRANDVVARLGGDEFAIVQIDAPQPQSAEALAARLVDLIGRSYIAHGHMITIGASVGVAIAPNDGTQVATLLKHADLALYRAKADGRGVYRFFQKSMDIEMQTRRLLELDLRKALALKEFVVFYQPQVDVESSTLLGFEALVRWRSPTRGLVSPGLFIPLAEEIGLITKIGEWVLRTACHDAASWSSPVSVSVNISPLQFRDKKLVPMVISALELSGLDAKRLELEITEGSLLDDTDVVLSVLQEFKALGVRLSMDDFGTGYSSLSYLQKFPFDKIKIDQSFVRGADQNADAGAIVRAVAALGKSLGMKTIAEGVETKEQLDRVRAEGCGEVQGYLTGRPLPAADAALLMSRPHPLHG